MKTLICFMNKLTKRLVTFALLFPILLVVYIVAGVVIAVVYCLGVLVAPAKVWQRIDEFWGTREKVGELH